jgi:HK97 family phage major capsid protein
MEMRRAMKTRIDEAKAIHEKAKREKRALSPGEQREYDDIMRDVESRKVEIETEERNQQLEMSGPAAPRDQPGSVLSRGHNGGGLLGFNRSGVHTEHRSLGEFIAAVRWESRQLSAGVGASGGFTVPDQIVQDIIAAYPEVSIVRPRATHVPPESGHPDAVAKIPALDMAAGQLGGIAVSWIGEGAIKPETDMSLVELALEPNELAAHLIVTDKLLRNSRTISVFLDRAFREALAAAEDTAFLIGDGVGKPLGVLNSPAALDVNRAAAGTVGFADLAAMVAALTPESIASGKALWVISQSAMPQIITMQDPGGNLIYQGGDASKGLPATLLGIPVRFTGRTSILGVRGDILLADFSYYLIKTGTGPVVSASEHPLFTSNRTVVKTFLMVDGHPWINAPIMLEDGVTRVSPFVALN